MNTSLARILTGLGIITLGIFALLSSFDVLSFASIARNWWPVAVIFAGLIMLINNPRNYLWALIVMIVGSSFLIRELGYTDFNIFKLIWPAALIVVGGSILFNRSARKATTNEKDREDSFAFLGGVDSKNTSGDYQGGKATAVMGGVTLDLRKAKIDREATLQVLAFWGGVEIKVPENWVVKSRAHAILGGVDNKANSDDKKGAPVLYIVGDVIMGGVDIKH